MVNPIGEPGMKEASTSVILKNLTMIRNKYIVTISSGGTIRRRLNNKLHSVDDPAVIYHDRLGYKEWWVKGYFIRGTWP